jgi:GNAT superfamily N-acetyltransferase
MSNGEARREHSKRPIEERRLDEKTLETLTRDFELWKSDPSKFDMPHVDEPAPITFHRVENVVAKGVIHGDIRAKDKNGEDVGYIFYAREPCDIHLSLLTVRPEHAGKGYSAFMMREFIDIQDKLCLNSTLQVVPLSLTSAGSIGAGEMEETDPELWKKNLEFLKKFYGSFGFEEVGKSGQDLMARKPVCEVGKKLDEECEELDLSELAEVMEDEPGGDF